MLRIIITKDNWVNKNIFAVFSALGFSTHNFNPAQKLNILINNIIIIVRMLYNNECLNITICIWAPGK
jgi:hypothetical protein